MGEFIENKPNLKTVNRTKDYNEILTEIKFGKCPSRYFCTVATTSYPEEKRTKICLDCWLRDMKERDIVVINKPRKANEK